MSADVKPATTQVELPEEIEQELKHFSALPTIRGRDAAVQYLKNEVGISVTKYAITNAVAERMLDHVLQNACLFFSPRALVRWHVGGLRQAVTR